MVKLIQEQQGFFFCFVFLSKGRHSLSPFLLPSFLSSFLPLVIKLGASYMLSKCSTTSGLYPQPRGCLLLNMYHHFSITNKENEPQREDLFIQGHTAKSWSLDSRSTLFSKLNCLEHPLVDLLSQNHLQSDSCSFQYLITSKSYVQFVNPKVVYKCI